MPETGKWKREFGAGGVVYKKENGSTFVLLIMPKGPNYGPPAGYWTLPKGLLDKDGEDEPTVAVREVKEEGGVNAKIQEDLGYAKFFRASKDYGNAFKIVHFYLMEYVDGNPADHDEEVAEAKWFNLLEAEATVKFPHDKEIIRKAAEILSK